MVNCKNFKGSHLYLVITLDVDKYSTDTRLPELILIRIEQNNVKSGSGHTGLYALRII